LHALFGQPGAAPDFCFSFDDALNKAVDQGRCLVAWSSRLTPDQEADAIARGVNLYRIEDGFVRSIGLGAGFVTAASLAVDKRGIYYDATRPSDIEQALETLELDETEAARGKRLREMIVASRLSKYNLGGKAGGFASSTCGRDVILVPGQVGDDASILATQSNTIDTSSGVNVNLQLLRAVRQRHPKAFVIYKPHPDVVSGLRKGALEPQMSRGLADATDADGGILELIDQADCIETISSLAGFEALLRGKQVVTHGLPFYAGWGLSEDLTPCRRRSRRRTVDELTAIALTRYTRHMNPLTQKACDAEELIDALSRQRTGRRHRLRNAVLKRAAWICERLPSA